MNTGQSTTFGQNLKALRKRNGITQSDMARTINTSRSCISNYELGNREPDNETIQLIADYFDVSVDYLFGRSAVKTIFKSNDNLIKLQELVTKMNSVDFFDVSGASEYVVCAVIKFYIYLQRKEKGLIDYLDQY